MTPALRIPIGIGARPSYIAARYANRHGLIAGATGSGKSVTLLTLAEGFSRAGIPVFLADVKGDLARISASSPVNRLDVFGQAGEAVSIRLDALGPDLAARLLALSEIQASTLEVAFEISQRNRIRLATLTDLHRVLHLMANNHRSLSAQFGLISPASIAAIQRALIRLEREGGAALFGTSTYDVADLLASADGGRGTVTLLDAVRLMRSPTLYAATLLFILGDLYERLPEVGDLDKPRLVLFFDEAHILFSDISPPLLQRIERTIRLIRSKGVGVYFASQSPADVPPVILGQLGNRVQHALRGATLADQKAIRATAETLPINPAIDAYKALSGLGVGSALVSTIGEDGVPRPVDLVRVMAPECLNFKVAAPAVRPMAGSIKAPATADGRSRTGTLAAAGVIGLAVAAFVGAVRAWLGV